jgi:hypothetical protein
MQEGTGDPPAFNRHRRTSWPMTQADLRGAAADLTTSVNRLPAGSKRAPCEGVAARCPGRRYQRHGSCPVGPQRTWMPGSTAAGGFSVPCGCDSRSLRVVLPVAGA